MIERNIVIQLFNAFNMKNKNNSKSYQVFAYGFWCIIIFFGGGNILPLIILGKTISEFNIFFFILVFGFTNISAFYAAKYFGLRPIRIQFDNEKIIFDFLKRDLKNIKKTRIYLLKDINGFSDFNFGGDQTFKLKIKNKDNFTIFKSRMWYRKDNF